MIVGPINPRPKALAIGGASTRAISSQKIACCIKVAPRPPYSFGQETAAQPPSWSVRCHILRYAKDSSSDFSRQLLQSLGTLTSSHERNSSRKATSSRVRFRSIPLFCSFVMQDRGSFVLRHARRIALPVFVSQISLPHFSRAGPGQSLQTLNGTWAFVVREARAAVFDELNFSRLGILLQNHQCLGHFSPFFVGYGYNGYFKHSGMRQKCFLNFQRGDGFRAGDDHVLLSVDDENVALLIPHRHVAGMEPAAPQCLGGGFGLPPIALHHTITARDDFAASVPVPRDILVVGVDDAQLDARHRVTRHGLPPKSLLAFAREAGLAQRDRQNGRRFRQAVSREARAAQFFFNFAHQRGRGCRATDVD